MSNLSRVLDQFRPGMRVFVPGSSGEPSALLAAWARDPERTSGLDLFTSLVPGINRLDPAMLHATTRLSGLFMQPSLAQAQREGRFRHLPLSYAGFIRDLSILPPFDAAIVQVSLPNEEGQCSLGPSAELTPAVIVRAPRTVALVNARTPFIPGAPTIALADFAAWAECDDALVTYETGAADSTAMAIARNVAPFVGDGAALQIGIGKVPAALAEALCDRRSLRIRSGLFSDGMRILAEKGALSGTHEHLATSLVGSEGLYSWAVQLPGLRIAGCERTHDPTSLAATQRLIAINSALEVDLFGQCNLETAGRAAISAAGGAPDFARAAKIAPGGRSIIALPATAARGTTSRIVAQIGSPGVVTIPRHDVDLIATEFGVADLRGRSVHERAEALTAIAAPQFRSDLAAQWRAIARGL